MLSIARRAHPRARAAPAPARAAVGGGRRHAGARSACSPATCAPPLERLQRLRTSRSTPTRCRGSVMLAEVARRGVPRRSSASGSCAGPLPVLRVDRALRGGPPRERQLPVGQVAHVLVEDRAQRGRRSIGAPWPGTTQSACSTSGRRRRASPGRRRATPAPARSSGSRPATGSRRTRARRAHGAHSAMPSAVWPSAGCSSSSCSPTSTCPAPAAPGPGRAAAAAGARRSSPRRTRAARAGRRRARRQARRGRLGHPERGAGEGEAAEHVVPVAVGGQQAADREAGLLEHRGQRLELVGEERRVDDERLARRSGSRCRSSATPADVATRTSAWSETTRMRARARPRRAAWPPRGGS